jgi:hypothetical protein
MTPNSSSERYPLPGAPVLAAEGLPPRALRRNPIPSFQPSAAKGRAIPLCQFPVLRFLPNSAPVVRCCATGAGLLRGRG